MRTLLASMIVCLAACTAAENTAPTPVVVRLPDPPPLPPPPPPTLGAPVRGDDGVWTAPFGKGTATLTLEPPLHDYIQTDMRMGRPQYGAVVIVDVETGRVLALAEHSEKQRELNGHLGAGAGLHPLGRAASVFKIVTSSALIRAGVPLNQQVCYSGGKTRMWIRNYSDDPRRDTRCVRFEDALPLSQNVAVAKLAGRFLTPEGLRDEAARFGLMSVRGKAPLEEAVIELPMERSFAAVPDGDLLGFVNTAAGFGEVRLSALQGALMAAMVGNDGVLVPPTILASVDGENMPAKKEPVQVLDEDHARMLQAMMTATVERGTATRAFSASHGPYGRLPPLDVSVAGKTGSLTSRDVDLDTSWFVGTAPAHDPKIAIGVVIINDEWLWYVRALDVARRSIARYFDLHPDHRRGQVVAFRRVSPDVARAMNDEEDGAATDESGAIVDDAEAPASNEPDAPEPSESDGTNAP